MKLLDLRIHYHGSNPGIKYHLCHNFHLTLVDLETKHGTASVVIHMASTSPFSRYSQGIRKVPPDAFLPFKYLMSAFNWWSLICIIQNSSHKGF